MSTISIKLPNPINFSLEIGDSLFFTNPTENWNESGFTVSGEGNTIVEVGEVLSISPQGGFTTIICDYLNNSVVGPTQSSFIMFGKNRKINKASLKGYYAEAVFKKQFWW